MMQIETGSVYRVKHRRKGKFYLAVKFTDKTFTTGMIIGRKLIAFSEEGEVSTGTETRVRNSLCEFERVQISEAQLS